MKPSSKLFLSTLSQASGLVSVFVFHLRFSEVLKEFHFQLSMREAGWRRVQGITYPPWAAWPTSVTPGLTCWGFGVETMEVVNQSTGGKSSERTA